MSDIDWKNPFRPEDFDNRPSTFDYYTGTPEQWMAAVANHRFKELIEQCPVVYGGFDGYTNGEPTEGVASGWVQWDTEKMNGENGEYDTHQARLIAIEKIKK